MVNVLCRRQNFDGVSQALLVLFFYIKTSVNKGKFGLMKPILYERCNCVMCMEVKINC